MYWEVSQMESEHEVQKSDGMKSGAEEVREEAQEEQLKAQARGDTGAELGAFMNEVVADHAQFPGDIVEDSKDPDRRVDEEQGVPEHPGVEPTRD